MSEVVGPLVLRGHRGEFETEVELKKIWYECVVGKCPYVNVNAAGAVFGRWNEASEFHKRRGALQTEQVLTFQEGFCFLE
jgi:hypothetical protein